MLQKTKMTFLRLFAIIGFVVLFAIASISLASCSSDTVTVTGMSVVDGNLVVTYSDGSSSIAGAISSGSDGATGATGATGSTGATGATGNGISSMDYDEETGSLVVTYTNGNTDSIVLPITSGGSTSDECDHTNNGVDAWAPAWTIKEASCFDTGLGLYYCTNEGCGEVSVQVIAATGHHTWVEGEKEATCTSEGYKYQYCSVCAKNDIETIAYVDENGKVLDDQSGATSTNTKYSITDKIPHSYQYAIDKDATQPATYDGTTETYTYSLKVTCKYDCDTVFENVTATVAAKDFDTETGAASCTEDGTATATLKYGDIEIGTVTLTIPATGHTGVDTEPVVAATAVTCADGNAALYYCSACQKYLIKVDESGEYTYTVSEVEGKTVVTETGTEWYVTALTGTSDTKITNTVANGGLVVSGSGNHTWVEDTKSTEIFGENECMYGSKVTYKCDVCGLSKVETTNPGVGYHTVESWTVKVTGEGEEAEYSDPTSSEAGVLVGTCTVCGKTVEIAITAINSDSNWSTEDKTSCITGTDITYTYTIKAGSTLTTLENSVAYLSERDVLFDSATDATFSYTLRVKATGHTYVSGSVKKTVAPGANINLQAAADDEDGNYIYLSDIGELTYTSVATGYSACDNTGYYQSAFYICDTCGAVVSVYVRTAHAESSVAAWVPADNTDGLTGTADYESDSQTSDSKNYVAATCGTDGSYWTYCTDCGAFIKQETIAATGEHAYKYTIITSDIKDYTYPSDYDADNTIGYVYYLKVVCENDDCGKDSFENITITLYNSDFDITTSAATCDENGTATATITYNGVEVGEVTLTIPATGHAITVYKLVDGVMTADKTVTIPTSTENGAIVGTIFIENDDDYYYAFYVLQTDLSGDNKDQYDEKNVVEIYKYSTTEYTYAQLVAANALILLSDSATYPCLTYGSAVFVCANESNESTTKWITVENIKTTHDYSKIGGQDDTEYVIYTSSEELIGKTTSISGIAYTYKSYAVAATCEADGYYYYSCSVCGKLTTIEGDAKTDHTYGDYENETFSLDDTSISVTLACTTTGCSSETYHSTTLTLTIPTSGWTLVNGYTLVTDGTQVYDVYTVTDTDGVTWTRCTYYADESNSYKLVYVITGATSEYGTVGTITATYSGSTDSKIVVYVVDNTIYLLDKTYVYTASATDGSIAELGGVVAIVDEGGSAACNSTGGVEANVTAANAKTGNYNADDTIKIKVKSEHTYVYLDATNYNTYSLDMNHSSYVTATYEPVAADCDSDQVMYQYCTTCHALVLVTDYNYIARATGHTYEVDTETVDGVTTEKISYNSETGVFTVTVKCKTCGETAEWTFTEGSRTVTSTNGTVGTVTYEVTGKTCVTDTIYTYSFTFTYTTSYQSAADIKGNEGNTTGVSASKSIELELVKGGATISDGEHKASSYNLLNEPVTYTYSYSIDSEYHKVWAYVCTVCGNEVIYKEIVQNSEIELTSGESGYTASATLVGDFTYDETEYKGLTSITATVTVTEAGYYTLSIADYTGEDVVYEETSSLAYAYIRNYTIGAYAGVNEPEWGFDWTTYTYGITSYSAKTSYIFNYNANVDIPLYLEADTTITIYILLVDDTTDAAQLTITVAKASTLADLNTWIGSTYGMEEADVEDNAFTVENGTIVFYTAEADGKYTFTADYDGCVYIYSDISDYNCDVNTSTMYESGTTVTLSKGDTLYFYSDTDYADKSIVTVTYKAPVVITYTGFDGEIYNISDYTGSTYTAGTTLIDGVLSISEDSGRLSVNTDCTDNDEFAVDEAGAIYKSEDASVDLSTRISINPVMSGTGSLTFILGEASNVTFYFGLGSSSVTFQVVDEAGNVYISVTDSDATTAYNILSASANLAAGTYIIKTETRGTAYLYAIAVCETTGEVIVPATVETYSYDMSDYYSALNGTLGNSGTTYYFNTDGTVSTSTSTILAYTETGNSQTASSISSSGYITTGGGTSSTNLRYFTIDLSEYEGYTVSITATMSSTGDNERSLILSTSSTTSSTSGALASATSIASGTKAELTYEATVVSESNSTLYLTCSGSVRVYSIEIVLTPAE